MKLLSKLLLSIDNDQELNDCINYLDKSKYRIRKYLANKNINGNILSKI